MHLAAVLVLLAAMPAWARSLRVTRWDTTVHVDQDGSARVTEQITYAFTGAWQGVYRDIPVDYPGPRGSNYSLFVTVEKVTDALGSPLKFEKKTSNGYLKLKVYVPGASDAEKTVNFEYAIANATKFFADYDEFYWNITGNDSPVPIESATGIFYFPAEASGALRAQAYQGIYGSKEFAKVSVEGPVASCETKGPLPMRGGLTMDIALDKGVLHQPGILTRAARFVRSNPILSLPVWAFGVMFSLWWLKGRDPDAGMSVAPMYEPPENMRPAEAGTLVDDTVNPRDITSVLVDLAVRGYIKIVETEQKGLLFSSKDYKLELLKDRNDWGDLSDYERAMLDKIFAGGHSTNISDLKNHFYTVLPLMKSQIMAGLKAKGMYTVDPESAAGYWGLGAVLVIVPFVLAQWFGLADFAASMGLTVVCGVIAVAIIVLIGRLLSATSLKGARTRVQVLGFQEFMNRVDADRLKRMPPDTFEKYLPFAMALGVEHRWAKAFEGIVQNPPTWYQGTDGRMFNSIYFVNSIGSMTQYASAAFVSAPRASSGSSGWSGGFGGGGFSGGGFGGGGTGGF